jgi:hypothetical protein
MGCKTTDEARSRTTDELLVALRSCHRQFFGLRYGFQIVYKAKEINMEILEEAFGIMIECC